MRYPDFLGKGGTIGFAAPSFGCATEPYRSAFDNAQRKLTDFGYRLKPGPNCYEAAGIGISNTPDKCGDELTGMYTDKECDCIISCGGGELMCEVLPYIDFDRISDAKPKWFMGYSDNTNFTFLSAILTDTAAIYGPCAAAFGMEPWHESIADALSVLTGDAFDNGKAVFRGYDKWELEGIKDEMTPLTPYNVTERSHIISLSGGVIGDYDEGITMSSTDSEGNPIVIRRPASTGNIRMSGRFIGGCLDCLVQMAGTPYDKVSAFTDKYSDDGIIWFLEACDLNPMEIRRAMWHLKTAGWFGHVRGFVFGRPLKYGSEAFGIDTYRAMVDIISDLKVPVLLDADIGHHPPMIPIICGSMADIETQGDSYSITMRLG